MVWWQPPQRDISGIDPRFAYRLVGQAVKASASRVVDPGFDSRLRRGDLSGSSHTSDLIMVLQWLPCQETGVRVSTGTGLPGVGIL